MLRTGWGYDQLEICPDEHYNIILSTVEEELKAAAAARDRPRRR